MFAKENTAASDSSPSISASPPVLIFPQLTLTLAHPSPSCWGCVVWILQQLIKRSRFYTVSLPVRAGITLASYFSSWLIVFNSLPRYVWFTGTCKSSGIDWVSFWTILLIVFNLMGQVETSCSNEFFIATAIAHELWCFLWGITVTCLWDKHYVIAKLK